MCIGQSTTNQSWFEGFWDVLRKQWTLETPRIRTKHAGCSLWVHEIPSIVHGHVACTPATAEHASTLCYYYLNRVFCMKLRESMNLCTTHQLPMIWTLNTDVLHTSVISNSGWLANKHQVLADLTGRTLITQQQPKPLKLRAAQDTSFTEIHYRLE